jgi:hypothetical protein
LARFDHPCKVLTVDAAPLLGFDPNDPEAWVVLADWLTACGDPRGLMLGLMRALDSPGDEAAEVDAGPRREELEALRRRHLHRYREALWPVFKVSSEVAARRQVELQWRAGLVIRARLLGPEPRTPAQISEQVSGLLDSEAALALAELRCDFVDPRPVVDTLLAGPPRPSLRALSLGDYQTPMPALQGLWPKLPGLCELELCGPGIALLELPARLTRLRLCCELDPSPLHLFAADPLPRLRALELRLGGHDYFGPRYAEPSATVQLHRLSAANLGRSGELLSRLLDGQLTPALEHLAITGVGFADELVAALRSSPLLPQLRSLDLSDSCFAPYRRSLLGLDDGARTLRLGASDLQAKQLEALHHCFRARLHWI